MIILTTKRKNKTTTLKTFKDIDDVIDVCIGLDDNNISYNIKFVETVNPTLVNVFWNGSTVYCVVFDGTKNINVSCGDYYKKEQFDIKDKIVSYWSNRIGESWESLRSMHEYSMICRMNKDYSWLAYA